MINKKEKLILIITPSILLLMGIFAIIYWDVISYLFTQMLSGVSIVKDYILSLGIGGVLVISIIVIVCFFIPVISSIPVQIASAVSYGLLFGVFHITVSVFIASQLVFLFAKSFHALQGKKQREKHQQLEEKIRSSKRSIFYFLLLAYLAPFVPFMLIHLIAAESGMKWWKYSLVTLLGPIPDIFVTLWVGEKIMTTSSPVVSFVIMFVVLTCVVLSLVFKEKIVNAIFNEKKEKDNG